MEQKKNYANKYFKWETILFLYNQEKWQKKVLGAELRITNLFIEAMKSLREMGKLPDLDDNTITLIGHNISIMGHTWAFRRWYFAKYMTIDEYIERQTEFIMSFLG